MSSYQISNVSARHFYAASQICHQAALSFGASSQLNVDQFSKMRTFELPNAYLTESWFFPSDTMAFALSSRNAIIAGFVNKNGKCHAVCCPIFGVIFGEIYSKARRYTNNILHIFLRNNSLVRIFNYCARL